MSVAGLSQRAIAQLAGEPLPQGLSRAIFLGIRLQLALRVLLVFFMLTTLAFMPPRNMTWVCVSIFMVYVVIVGCWRIWALRPDPVVANPRRLVTFLALAADVAVVSILAVLTGITSPESWASDVLMNGLFLIPLIAAAQLSPDISAAMAIPTVLALVAASWISKSANQEPWLSIFLRAAILCGLAGGSVALSRIQRSRVVMIEQLARQRTELLDELLGVEKRERSALSERLHDGALQYVLLARQDLDDVRLGSAGAVQRVETALVESSHLLRNVVRELHPEVLVRFGLKSAVDYLADNISSRSELAVELDMPTWPDGERTDVDDILYAAAREMLTNVVKHARARSVRIELGQDNGLALLRIVDDGVGISDADVTRSVEGGHIGLASTRTKVLASGGEFDVRANSIGTEATISIPLRPHIWERMEA
jgi:two-component system, NarL family, sensor kinase